MSLPVLDVRSVSKSFPFKINSGHSRRRLEAAVADGVQLEAPAPGPRPGMFWALREVDLSVRPGESVGIIGKNGSGKSTLLKIISRIMPPTEGSVTIRGKRHSLLEVGTGFHPELSGLKNIYLSGAICGFQRREIDALLDQIIDFSGVEPFIDMPIKFYSGGMYVRLAFSVGVHLRPELLVIDEVIAVGDAAFQKRCEQKIADMVRNGCALLLVSHDAAKVSSLCQSAVWLRAGRVQARGPALEVGRAYAAAGAAHA